MSNISDNKRSQATKTQLIKALFELIQTHKIQDISVSELCQLANINRTTFYNHYDNINQLATDARNSITTNYSRLFQGNTNGYTPANLFIMFQHLYANQILYNTYFKLNPNYDELLGFYDKNLARHHYPHQPDNLMRYHAEFFAAGITAIIKRWLATGCKETPAEMTRVIVSEYHHKA